MEFPIPKEIIEPLIKWAEENQAGMVSMAEPLEGGYNITIIIGKGDQLNVNESAILSAHGLLEGVVHNKFEDANSVMLDLMELENIKHKH